MLDSDREKQDKIVLPKTIESQQNRDLLANVYQAKTIRARFDALCALIQELKQNLDNSQQLRQQAIAFAMAIVDAQNEEDLLAKIKQRESDKKQMPWKTPTFSKDALSKDKQNIFREQGYQINTSDIDFLEKKRVFFNNGAVKKIVTDDEDQLTIINFDTKDYTAIQDVQEAIAYSDTAGFVILPSGDMFAYTQEASTIVTSTAMCSATFSSGEKVSATGTFSVNNGVIESYTNFDPIYQPTAQDALNTLDYFKKNDANKNIRLIGIYNPLHEQLEGILLPAGKEYEHPMIGEDALNKIKNKINKYIQSREKSLRYFANIPYDQALTSDKASNATSFLNEIESMIASPDKQQRSDKFKELITQYRNKDDEIEKSHNKTYGLFTSSQFKRVLDEIQEIVKEKDENHKRYYKGCGIKYTSLEQFHSSTLAHSRNHFKP